MSKFGDMVRPALPDLPGLTNKLTQLEKISRALDSMCKEGRLDDALEILEMQNIPLSRDNAYYLLRACTKKQDTKCGRRIQILMAQNRLDSIEVLGNHLIRLFASCGCLPDATQAFRSILQPTVYTWSAIILAHANLGDCETAMQFYTQMQSLGVKRNWHVYVAVLKACTLTSSLKQGRHAHLEIVKSGIELDVVLGSSLVDMYAKCGSLEESCQVFSGLLDCNVISWGATIAGLVQHGEDMLAMKCFARMQDAGIEPNEVIFLSTLKACGNMRIIGQGRFVHDQILKCDLQLNVVIGSAIIDMYAKCGSLEESCKAFGKLSYRDVVSWGAIISGYSQHGNAPGAFHYFEKMQEEGVQPDEIIFPSALKACGSIGALEQGRLIHEQILGYGVKLDAVIGSALVDMYAKCGKLEESHKMFINLLSPNVVTWGAMIAGYAQHGEGLSALACFENMQKVGIMPNELILSSILKACGSIGAIGMGRSVCDKISDLGYNIDIVMGVAIVDMYAKCGSLEDAGKIFKNLPNQTTLSWSAMIAGYALHGDAMLALACFKDMESKGIKPDKVTFLSVLIACSRVGLVNIGRWYFVHMQGCYDISPDEGHINCMVDVLSRAGCFIEAVALLQATKKPDLPGWMSLLSACWMHGSAELGRWCFNEVICLDPSYAPAYVLMANIYRYL